MEHETLLGIRDSIMGELTLGELTQVREWLRVRAGLLKSERGMRVTVGFQTRLTGLSPKYLNGLTGKVEVVTGKRVAVRLDAASTRSLQGAGRRFYVTEDEHLLTGVPIDCCDAAV